MKKVCDKAGDSKPDVDKAKRVYRAALEAIRRLDEISKQKKAYREVFHQDAVGLRNKLKEYCERLMFYNPSDYGRKAEEVLWRKVFYEIIQLMKHNRKHIRMGSSLEAAFRTHLSSATGYYYHLLFRLQQEFGLKLYGILDFNLVPEQKTVIRKLGLQNSVKKRDFSSAVQSWAMSACHRCLVCLGDIARYQQDFDKGLSKSSAERFYYQAITLFPENGMPHNQLGTLSGSRFYNVEAAYYYIRCLVCDKPFEGADGNLQRLFEKNNKRLAEIQHNLSLPPEVQRVYDTKMFLIQFLQLVGVFHATDKQLKPSDIQEKCQSTLQKFNLCMFYEADMEEDRKEENLYFLDDDIIFKLVVICMATIHLLQLQGSGQTTAATAFLLALFSHILNHVVMRLQASLYNKENPNKILSHTVDQEDDDMSDDDLVCNGLTSDPEPDQHLKKSELVKKVKVEMSQQDTEDDNDLPKKKSRQSRLKSYKRRRRRAREDSSDSSDLSDMSDLSEGGEDLPEDFMSEESEGEEEFVGFFTNDSDSDMSDHLMDSQELEPGFSSEGKNVANNKLQTIEEKSDSSQNTDGTSNKKSVKPDPNAKVNPWLKSVDRDSLAHFSSELFSSSMSFLGQNFKLSSQTDKSFEKDIEEFETCKDVIQGRKQVSIPPGFASTSEARHVAEITNKLANFVIETDTEASIMPTDAEQSATETEEQSSETESVERSEDEHRQLQYMLDIIQQEGLLSVVKLMCDWMKCNTGVITTCAQSSQSLWHRLSILLNILPKEAALIDHDHCWIDDLKDVLKSVQQADWKQVIPLREDISLCQLSPLADIHNTIEFTVKRRGQLNEVQETFLRIGCIRQFGYFLSGLDTVQFNYEEVQGVFVGPAQTNSSGNEKVAMQRVAVEESRRNQLMKDMAQLRLQAEVTQLEGSLDSNDQGHFPPYLIPDTSSLCDSLPLVKQLTQTSKGIVIIPLAVIDSLDYMKKESVGAREAIRWLETEFRKGNRYIRAQKSNEKLQENTPKNLKKKSQEMWCLYEIFSCARYLAGQGDIASGNMVAVMSKQDLNTMNVPDIVKQLRNKCTQEGIGIENISTFANKWKDVLKNKG